MSLGDLTEVILLMGDEDNGVGDDAIPVVAGVAEDGVDEEDDGNSDEVSAVIIVAGSGC
jgi:hypothetical protein